MAKSLRLNSRDFMKGLGIYGQCFLFRLKKISTLEYDRQCQSVIELRTLVKERCMSVNGLV